MAEQVPGTEPAAEAEPEALPALQVLLVDPMASSRVVTLTMLEEAGHHVFPVSDWETGEDILLREEVDAVVMAFTGDGFDGPDAAQRLRDRLPPQADLPLVGTTDGLRRGEEDEAMEAGFDVLLVRPFTPEELTAALAQARKMRTPPPVLDDERRAALRKTHTPAALEALEDEAMAVPASLLVPLFRDGGEAPAYAAAGGAVAEAMDRIGAIGAASAARRMADNADEGRRFLFPLLSSIVAARVALRKDRVAASAADPIWAAGDTPPSSGDTP
jgi:CheY-like chemotaxis protein